MKTIYLNKGLEKPLPSVATIGFFDGVHLGHRHVIRQLIRLAEQAGLASTVITFERHPRQVLQTEWRPQLLSTLDEKVTLLSATGIDQLVILPFDAAMAALPSRDFIECVLVHRLGVKVLLTGYDNHFGHRTPNFTEGFDDYVRYGRELGISVVACDAFDAGTVRVSSSKVRKMLQAGDVEQAGRCLGRLYQLVGTVVNGEHVGTGLGYPTANLQLNDIAKLIPAPGVYAVKVRVGETQELLNGMMNIGHRPTFDGHKQTLETNIFHFDGDLYGRQIAVSFVSRLRAELKFDSGEALAAQLAADARQSEEILNHQIEI